MTVNIENNGFLTKSHENRPKIAKIARGNFFLESVTIVYTKIAHLYNKIQRNELLTPTATMHGSCA